MADSSDSDLSSEWAVINPVEDGDKKPEVSEHDNQKDIEESSENVTDIGLHSGSGIELLLDDHKAATHSESSSSSDIDIIEETMEDSAVTSIFPSVFSGDSSTGITSSMTGMSEMESTMNEVEEVDNHTDTQRTIGGRTMDDWLTILINTLHHISNIQWCLLLLLLMPLCFHLCTKHCPSLNSENSKVISQMKELVRELKFENRDLKNQMISEIQNEKVFAALEYQIKELKNENLKLSDMLQDVILELQKQSVSSEKELQSRASEFDDTYKNEINKLREQVNILQFDNEELQKQLVRMRYGRYSSSVHMDNHANVNVEDGSKESKESVDDKGNEESGENSSSILTEQVRELRNELQSELLKLKKWNELVELLTKDLHKSSENKESFFEDKKSSKKKQHNWSWRDFKRNVKGAINNLPKINISEMFTKYMKSNQKRVEDVFQSIGNFFRVAQEKTQKMLHSHSPQKRKNNYDIWSMLGDLNEQWRKIKNDFYQTNFKDGKSVDENELNNPEFSNSFLDISKSAEENTKHEKHTKQERKFPYQKSNIFEDSSFEEIQSEIPEDEKKFREFKMPDHHLKEHDKRESDSESNSWMFERAAHRAKLRDDDHDYPIKWYLQRRRGNIYGKTYEDIIQDDLDEINVEDVEEINKMNDEQNEWKQVWKM